MKRKKRNIIIISAAVAAGVLGAVFLTLGLTIWRPWSTAEWLEVFNQSFGGLEYTVAADRAAEQPLAIGQRIRIEENGQTVALFEHALSLDFRDSGRKGYLTIDETYPSLGSTQEDIHDAYYLEGGMLYLHRENGGEELTSRFASDQETLFTLASENIGSVGYVFCESDFSVPDGSSLIVQKEGAVILCGEVRAEAYGKFFANKTDNSDIGGVTAEMKISEQDHAFLEFTLKYQKGGRNYTLETTCHKIDGIERQSWVTEEVL